MFNIGPQELLLVLIVALIIVGPKRLPELGRTVGRWLNEFRKIQDEVKDMVKFDLGTDPVDVEDPVVSTTPSVSDHHDDDPVHGEDGTDATEGEGGEDGDFDESDDGMTHSERVIATMPDDEPDAVSDTGDETPHAKDEESERTAEPLTALPEPKVEPEPTATPPDAASAAAAE